MRPQKVLVVDDEPALLRLMEYLLQHEGYQVIAAKDGSEALDAAAREIPDLILLDVVLPDVDGLDVCRRLRGTADTADIPIWMVSARVQHYDIENSLAAGANEHIGKPFKPRDLAEKIRALFAVCSQPTIHAEQNRRQPSDAVSRR